jgi:hypothetical protein
MPVNEKNLVTKNLVTLSLLEQNINIMSAKIVVPKLQGMIRKSQPCKSGCAAQHLLPEL